MNNFITLCRFFSTDVWQQILIPILKIRKEAGLVNLFPEYISGEVSGRVLTFHY